MDIVGLVGRRGVVGSTLSLVDSLIVQLAQVHENYEKKEYLMTEREGIDINMNI